MLKLQILSNNLLSNPTLSKFMNENWSEIIEIMKPVIGQGRNRDVIKMALSSCLRTLGWRTTTGSMRNDFITKSGKTIDIVLGKEGVAGYYHIVLPILINTEKSENDIIDYISGVMLDINVKIAIVVGSSFNLYFFDNDIQKAVLIGNISFEQDNEEGLKFSSLFSAHEFDETNLIVYFASLYKSRLPRMKLDSLIRSLISDNSKAEEVLRLYLEYEGFEGEIVDDALRDVGVDIFFKNDVASEEMLHYQEPENKQLSKSGHDNTRFSLNGGPFLSKRHFVLSVVSQFVQDNPTITLEQLETRFPSEIASKERGVIRTWEQVQSWATEKGPDILSRYCSKTNEIITLYDGTKIVVNSQWGSRNFPRFLALAKTLYQVNSDAPYEGVECIESISTAYSNPGRAKNFKFSMVGIKVGETIVFDATNTKVKVASDDTIEYNGSIYRLSAFVRAFIPNHMRNNSNSYRGPEFFSYNGETLTSLRDNSVKKQVAQTSNGENDETNKCIHISLESFKSFKTGK